MPYELAFDKALEAAGADRYFNDCCIGGDIVSAALLPALRARYGAVEPGQEDWGWFLWSASNGLRLAVDIFTEDPAAGRFRVRLSTSMRGLLGGRKELDVPELDELMRIVTGSLTSWVGSAPSIERVA